MKLWNEDDEDDEERVVNLDVIYNDDCVNVLNNYVDKESVHLTVTSPPYINLREYSQWQSVQDYLKDNRRWADALFQATVPGGHVCWNIQDTIPHRMLPEVDQRADGEKQQYPFMLDVVQTFLDAGFTYKNQVIWYKGVAGGAQKLFGSYPIPPNHMITHVHEVIHIFRKPLLNNKPSRQNREESKITKEEWVEYAQSLWEIRPETTKSKVHSAPYPKEIPHRCIKLFSCVGDVVFDPFMGSGTTADAAIDNKRHYIGSELDTDYFNYLTKHLEEYSVNLPLDNA